MSSYNIELQKQVLDFLFVTKMSQAAFAEKLTYGKTAFNQWLKSKYTDGNIAKMETEIQAIFDLQAEREVKEESKLEFTDDTVYLPMSTSEDICKFLRYCHLEKGVMLVHGDAGVGKTKATVKYEQDNPTTTIYVESRPSTSSLRETLRQIANKLRVSTNLKTAEMSEQIKQKLKASNYLLIIDEAQNLSYRVMEELTRWGDPDRITNKPNVAIMLMGNSVIRERIERDTTERYLQQRNRIRYRREYRAERITMQDAETLFPYLHHNGMTKELNFLLSIARGRDCIRGAMSLYNNAVNRQDVSYDALLGIALDMDMKII